MKEIMVRNVVSINQIPLTVTLFQKNAATGTFMGAAALNDGNTGMGTSAEMVNEYAEIDFGRPMIIKQYRQFGNVGQAGNGRWKITYWNDWKQDWIDWVPALYVYAVAEWYSWASTDIVETSKIRLVCTVVDGGGTNRINELEMKY